MLEISSTILDIKDTLWVREMKTLTVIKALRFQNLVFIGNTKFADLSEVPLGSGTLIVANNPNLLSINNEVAILEKLYLQGNALTGISLNKLNIVPAMEIKETSITTLKNEFPEVLEITGFMVLSENKQLTNIDNIFPKLISAGYFFIQDNLTLKNINNGFRTLETIQKGLSIQDNASLPKCDVTLFLERISVMGDQTILNNTGSAGCIPPIVLR